MAKKSSKNSTIIFVILLIFIIAIGFLAIKNVTGFQGMDASGSGVPSTDASGSNTSYIDISGARFNLPKKLVSHDIDTGSMDSTFKDMYYNGISKLFNGFLYS
jgi:hypothetical protein